MDMLTTLKEFGIDPAQALVPESLVTLRAAYVSLVDSAKETVKVSNTVLDETKKKLSSNKELKSKIEGTLAEMREQLFNMIDEEPRLSVLLVDAIQELKQNIMFERDHWIATGVGVPRNTVKPKTSAEYELKRNQAKQLGDAIDALFLLLGKPANLGEAFPVKDSKEGVRPDIPNLPRSHEAKSEGQARGRAAILRRIRFSWKPTAAKEFEELPADTLPADVARNYVSDRKRGFLIDWSGISKLVKESGKSVLGNEEWVIKLPTGTLKGIKVNPEEKKETEVTEETSK